MTGDGVTCTDTDGCADQPCYTGVTCDDVPAPGDGFECGDCPDGYEGDGIDCTDIDGCADQPCFAGVTCDDVPAPGDGFTCGQCPPGTTGDGVTCDDIDGCADQPCYEGVACQDVAAPDDGFTCGDCPEGYEGDGADCYPTQCDPNPCWEGVACTTDPTAENGYTCGLCPEGMFGDGATFCGYRITATLGEGGHYWAWSPDGPQGQGSTVYAFGTEVTITAYGLAGYALAQWEDVLTGEVLSTDNPWTVTVEASLSLRAVFGPSSHVVTVGATDGGTATGEGIYLYGETATLTATASESYTFKHWVDDDSGNVFASNPYAFTVGTDRSFTAVFEYVPPPTWTVTLSSAPAAGGTTSQTGGPYEQGETVTISATANPGYRFVAWRNASNTVVSTDPVYDFTMGTANASFNALFEAVVTVTLAQGTLRNTTLFDTSSATLSGAGVYPTGSQVVLEATPAFNRLFKRWELLNAATGTVLGTYTDNPLVLSQVNADVTLRAVFVDANQYVTTDGNDSTGLGTPTAPWRTIGAATSFLSGLGGTAHVKAGQYDVTSTLLVGRGTRLLGGYVGTGWTTRTYLTAAERADTRYKTEIRMTSTTDAQSEAKWAVRLTHSDTLLEGFTIVGAPAGAAHSGAVRIGPVSGVTPVANAVVRYTTIDAGGGTTSRRAINALPVAGLTIHDNVVGAGFATTSHGIQVALMHPGTIAVHDNVVQGGEVRLNSCAQPSCADVTALVYDNTLRPSLTGTHPATFVARAGGEVHYHGNLHVHGGTLATGTLAAVDLLPMAPGALYVLEGNTIVGGAAPSVVGVQLLDASDTAVIEIVNNTILGGQPTATGGRATGADLGARGSILFANNTVDPGRSATAGARQLCGVRIDANTSLRNNIVFTTPATITNLGTFSANSYATGICADDLMSLDVRHNVFWPAQMDLPYPATAPWQFSANAAPYAGNAGVDPLLVNTVPESFPAGDWRLQAESPVVVRFGAQSLSDVFGDDKDGVKRSIGGTNPGNGGGGWSMGAYEY